ncbi:MAG: hypothetical protein COA71_13880 [SAR86 cluster bacterium]|uniref:Cytochrome C n=1 Tax=SAR86 cluster bacterium TaxID=2030880 RepID=A0A2A5C6M1_9GAMM|nr:MAG: hypothetical protein COA71_13880 [SAR86 cluster bacterium]
MKIAGLLKYIFMVFGFWVIGLSPAWAQIEASPTFSYDTRHTISEIMSTMADPAAWVLWNPTEEFDDDGSFVIPDDDDFWNNLRNKAVILGEVANLINMPGRVSNNRREETAAEVVLSAEEFEALIKEQRPAWEAYSAALTNIAAQYYQAAQARDASAYDWEGGLGAQMNTVCASCHLQFWYPK